MKEKRLSVSFAWIVATLLILALVSVGCGPNPDVTGGSKGPIPLASWNETGIKEAIIDFVTSVSDPDAADYIPQRDRIAVFDMDGTIVCEQPLWLEMNVAVDHMFKVAEQKPWLIEEDPLYKIAYDYHQDPNNPVNRHALEENAVAIMTHAFEGISQEEYVATVTKFMNTVKQQELTKPGSAADTGILYKETFYQPMLELITYLQRHGFQVYIVSGSEQGLIWGVCAEQVPLPRDHQIGTRIALDYTYNPSQPEDQFTRGDHYLAPRNLAQGKAENIYYQLGQTPVFAFGNTADDFEMFKLALSSKYTSIAFVLDHDDRDREYSYPTDSVRQAWKKTADKFGWHVVSMKDNFKQVFLAE